MTIRRSEQSAKNRFTPRLFSAVAVAIFIGTFLGAAPAARADDALIRKQLGERIPNLPKIDEIRPSGFPGMFEVRIGNDVAYTDAKGDYLIRGSVLRTADKRDLTQERLEQLQRVPFKDLPLRGALVHKNGTGERRVVIFADPNCGYCKKLEEQIASVPNLTVYTVIIPILGADSAARSQSIWCAKNKSMSWTDWMIRGVVPAKALDCATPFTDNLQFAKKHNIGATPTIFFEDGSRKAGAIPLKEFEDKLKLAGSAKS